MARQPATLRSQLGVMFSRNGRSAADALRDRRRQALAEWRRLVGAHEAGEAVDLARIEELARAMGIRDPASAFGRDCDAQAEMTAAEAELRREEEAYREAVARSVEASAKLFALKRQLQQAEHDIAMAPHMAHGAAVLRARMLRIMEQCPRLFAERHAAEVGATSAPIADPLVAIDRAEAMPIGHGVAEFTDDDGND